MGFDSIDVLILMSFFVAYIAVFLQLYSSIKKRQIQKNGDKELTLALINEAKQHSSNLYNISSELSYSVESNQKFEIIKKNLTEIMIILNLYNALAEGSSQHTLNKRLVLVLMNDNFIIAQKSFAPYFPVLRDLFNNQQLFVSFEYLLSRNVGS